MLSERQKTIMNLCRSADRCVNTALRKGGTFFLCMMFVSATPPFTEFLVLQKKAGHIHIAHIVKPGLIVKKSGVTNATN